MKRIISLMLSITLLTGCSVSKIDVSTPNASINEVGLSFVLFEDVSSSFEMGKWKQRKNSNEIPFIHFLWKLIHILCISINIFLKLLYNRNIYLKYFRNRFIQYSKLDKKFAIHTIINRLWCKTSNFSIT